MLRHERGLDAEVMWADDGFVVRVPESDTPLDPALLMPDPDDVERLVVAQLGATAMFAARFREAAGRALLLPRRRPGARAPLWQQRKRAADLLAVAARFGSFPIILETYRECLRDVFDLPALVDLLRKVRSRAVRVHTVDVRTSSPFAASLLFGYVANYLYDGDAPLAERRAHALSVDQSQLAELIGEGELRALLDPDALASLERDLQQLPEKYHARAADGVHDLLLRLGDLTPAEIAARAQPGVAAAAVPALLAARRVVSLRIGGETRVIAVEDAARYRDGLGAPLPPGLPAALLEPVRRPDRRPAPPLRAHARPVHGRRSRRAVRPGRRRGRRDAAPPGRRAAGWSRASSGRARAAASGAMPRCCDRCGGGRSPRCARTSSRWSRTCSAASSWAGTALTAPRAGLDALLDAIEQLQGAPLVASVLEREVLPARVAGYAPAQLDTLVSAGEVIWVGVEPLGERDGRIALYLTDQRAALDAASGRGRRPARARGAHRGVPHEARRRLLRPAARRGGRRLPARDGGRAVESRVAGPGHERHAASAARLCVGTGAHAARCARRARPTASARAGSCRRRRRAAGRCSRRRRRRARPPGRRPSRANCWRGTAW